MSSESTPGAALNRLVEVAAVASRVTWSINSEGIPVAAGRLESARSMLLAVLPALADELQRLRADGTAVGDLTYNDAIDRCSAHLRSLAAPADDQEGGKFSGKTKIDAEIAAYERDRCACGGSPPWYTDNPVHLASCKEAQR